MGTENFGLPTDVEGIVAFRATLLRGFQMIDAKLKELQDAAGGEVTVRAEDIEGVTDTGLSVMGAASQEAARLAIGAGTSSFSGNYGDLEGRPTIPAAPAKGTAAQLVAGTATTGVLWSAADLAAEIDRRIAAATPVE